MESRTIRALVVEDDPDTAAMMRKIFESSFSAQVEIAGNLASARRKLSSDEYDIMTIDLKLPDGEGHVLLEEYVTGPGSPRAIIVTGHGDEEVARRSFRLGASGYVMKDERLPTMLVDAVESALAEVELMQAEEEVREGDERFRLLAEATSEGIILHDEGRIIDANSRFAEMYGYDPGEVIGMSAFDLVAPESREFAADRLRAHDESPYEGIALRKDGSKFPVQVHGRTVPYKGRMVRVTAIRDLTERKMAEEAVYAMERRLRQLVEGMPVAVLLVDAGGTPRYSNKIAERLLGRETRGVGPEARAGLWAEIYKLYSAGTGDLYPMERIPIVRALDGEFVTVDDIEIRRPEEVIPIEMSAAPVFDESGNVAYAVAVFTDVTMRKQAEEALRQAEEKYRSIVENAVDGIYQSTPEGRFITVNPALARMWGFEDPDEMISSIHDVTQQYVEAGRRAELRAALEGGGFVQGFEAEIYRKDGAKVWIAINGRAVRDPRGRVLFYEGTIEEVTERKRAQDALRESEQRYRTVIETSPDGIVLVDLNYAVVTINKQAVELLGYDEPAEMLGRNAFDFVAAQDRVRGVEYALKTLETRKVTRGEYLMQRKDGSLFPVEASASAVAGNDGKPAALVITIRDITKRKLAEEALQRVNAELEGYAHTVSHDLKGPLSAILMASGTLETMLDSTPGVSTEVVEVARMIGENVEKADSLIGDLLLLAEAGQQPTDVEDVDVKRVVDDVLKEREGEVWKKGVKVTVSAGLGTVRANRTHMYQLFSNLIGNAIKHNDSATPRVDVLHLGDDMGGRHRFLVRDNGSGIPAEILGKIFTPFIKGESGQTGMGLTIVEKIVEVYGGEIRAYNDDGACFEFTINDST